MEPVDMLYTVIIDAADAFDALNAVTISGCPAAPL